MRIYLYRNGQYFMVLRKNKENYNSNNYSPERSQYPGYYVNCLMYISHIILIKGMIPPHSTDKETYAQINKWSAKIPWLAYSTAGLENLDLSDSNTGVVHGPNLAYHLFL